MTLIKVKEDASPRTRHRIYQFGPHFTVGRELPDIVVDDVIIPARLLSSHKTDWVGWVAADEIYMGD